jgi:hypothetical protein
MTETDLIKRSFELLAPALDERTRRLVAAAQARAIGWGGITAVARATGVSRRAIREGMRELSEPQLAASRRVRREGAGRKRAAVKDPTLLRDVEQLVEPVSRGDPESPLRWTCKSLRKLSEELNRMGHRTSRGVVAGLLRDLGYSLQANRKVREGGDHPDRDAQFRHINEQVEAFQASGDPVISVDTKKKELVGDFKNGGREWRPQGNPEAVRVHDFVIPELGKVSPYGVYDLARDTGWVNVGTDHDTATFAVESIRRWWASMGRPTYPRGRHLLITADGGGSNGYRLRQWKVRLQALADEAQITIRVCHFPPGTSKWNKVEHRLFSFISSNWRGEPLRDYETIVQLIARTTTAKGLRVTCRLDRRRYPVGHKVSNAEIAAVSLWPNAFHAEWNYAIKPRAVL